MKIQDFTENLNKKRVLKGWNFYWMLDVSKF